MRSIILGLGVVLTAIAAPAFAQTPADYSVVLAAESRPAEDRARDDARHAAETLAFAQVRPGQHVADMIIGGGYFTRIFSAAVGEEGRVTAWQPEQFMAFQASYRDALTAADSLPNVDVIASLIDAPAFPGGLDLIFTAQNYHDLHLDPFPDDTAAKVNAAAFAALKPGGLYVIIDHHALADAPVGPTAQSLHRIDAAALRAEVEAAGFVFDGEAGFLAQPADPRTANVFDEAIRGRTDQFAYRFRKPD